MLEEFDLVKKHLTSVHFRVEDWFLYDLDTYMAQHDLDNRTQALHEYVSSLKNRIKQLEREIKDLKRAQRSYPQEREPPPSPEPPSVSAPEPKPVSKIKIHCPHYAKQGIDPMISEDTCQKIQKVRPDLCRAVNCKRFNSDLKPQEKPEKPETRPRGLM